ncbi:very long-chain-fatty-acid--CoA ligase bubblegum [Achroia grisella]|uniref:very long-chain-fatty-acid--CoA ligase bubblegum n=1 Tax=Achroia grisella TaxID=688607 RepID=UPI0027D24BFD|nr:very long-chain-fatty-acid--CoA ligase bubblegum [Achroia grisella]
MDNTTVTVENGEEIVKVHKMHISKPVPNRTSYMNGPDQLLPATSYITTYADGAVKLRIAPRGLASERPLSVPGLLNQSVARYPDAIALASKKEDGKWHKLTYTQYREKVRIIAKAFLKLGLERYHSVCILGFNTEQWFIADLAAIHAGGFAAGIYTTNSAEACFHCLVTSRANICVVQDKKQLDKVLSVRNKLPHLKAIVQWENPVDTSIQGLFSWDQILEIGKKEPDDQLDYILKHMAVNECCTLVYTSGTVGSPKAVMLSHDNLTWDAFSIGQRVADVYVGEKLVSFLPLSHVAAQVVDIYTTLMHGVTVFFAQPDALKGSLVETLKEIRPTRFLGVPRVWEKMHEKIVAVSSTSGFLTRCIANWARDKGLKHHLARIDGFHTAGMRGLPIDFSTLEMLTYWQRGTSFGYKMAKSLVFNKVHATLGLDKCTTFVTSAAPLSADIKKFFCSLDMPIMEAFGMSELAGAHTLSIYPGFSLDASGEVLGGTETKFGGSPSPNGPGEIMMNGRHVLMGYLDEPEKTLETLDSEGWLLSGDIGRLDSRNLLYITGRIKELLITAGGENVAPVPIEQIVQAELPHLGYAVLIGDKRKFLSIIVTLKAKLNTDTGAALDDLESETRKWVAGLGSQATTISEIYKSKDPAVHKAIEEGIKRANKYAISNAQKIQKFAILPADFSLASGELGPTLKIKRSVVYEKYKDIIEGFYKE